MTSSPIKSPAPFVASYAMAFADNDGMALTVSQASPLPVNLNVATALPISGSVTVGNTGSAPLAVSGGVTVNNPTSSPIPVNAQPAATTPLAGTATTSMVAGPFQPVVGRSVILALTGTWTGTVAITRSTDSGTTKLPLTMGGIAWGIYSTNCCEAVWDESEASATLYLQISLTSGTATYRFSQ